MCAHVLVQSAYDRSSLSVDFTKSLQGFGSELMLYATHRRSICSVGGTKSFEIFGVG